MSKELEALQKIGNQEMISQFKSDCKGGFVYRIVADNFKKEFDLVEKLLKALKIIKENLHKFGDEYEVLRYSKETDDYVFLDFRISKEEFKLLKEVLTK